MRFLHDSQQSSLDSYYCFKDGFVPSHSRLQKELLERLDVVNRNRSLQERVKAEELITIPIPSPDNWILFGEFRILGPDPSWTMGQRGRSKGPPGTAERTN
jgi:hypothetical protein